MRARWFEGILIWVVITGITLVGLAIVLIHAFDTQIIERVAARNMHAEFLHAAGFVSRIVGKSHDIHDVAALQEAFGDIFELRRSIRRLSVYALSPASNSLVLSSDSEAVPHMLTEPEQREIAAGRSVTYFDSSTSDRAWIITAPIVLDGAVIGALRGRYSLRKYDSLIQQEGQLAKDFGIGAVVITSLVFLLLVRVKVHEPIGQLLRAMRKAETGDLTGHAPLSGPADIQEVARQYNRMLDRVRDAIEVKEQLLGEVKGFNEMLTKKVAETRGELQRTNTMLVEARIQTERAEKLAALGELSAVMAHELGNPLNSISGHLQLLMNSHEDPQAHHRHLGIIRAEIERMVTIIEHILQSTRLQVQSAPVDLNDLIRDIEGLIATGLSEKRIVLKTDLAAPLPPVAGDRRAIHGMVFNLVTNAIQAMAGGGELRIKTLEAVDDRMEGSLVVRGGALKHGAVRLLISDTGLGIPSEHLQKIFEPFFTTRHAAGGTGLGLAICHRVVSSLGGRIAVSSRVGQGSCFTVDLPVWNKPK
ncbi:MAG TPA: ATP-binding protein [Nitrospira sp.]|nr:ATP-binding protein [Nitrospira sp.]